MREPRAQTRLQPAHILENFVAPEDFDVPEGDRGRQRMSAQGEAMSQRASGLQERLGDTRGYKYRPHRRVGGCQAFGNRHKVGLDPKAR
jgi:hypothetical protein